MLTGEQVRAARALLGWSEDHLAEAAHLSADTVRRFEDGEPAHYQATSDLLRRVLEAAGAEFFADNGSVCVNFGGKQSEGIRPEDLNAENDD